MRRVLFVHNGPLFRDGQGRVYGIHFTNQIVERYRYLGQQVTFLMREQRLDGDPAGYSLINAEDFAFVAAPNIAGPVARARHMRSTTARSWTACHHQRPPPRSVAQATIRTIRNEPPVVVIWGSSPAQGESAARC